MPTGYTAPLYEGKEITFEQFVLRCSRAMGAAIMQRDDSLDVEIQERTVDSWYEDSVKKAREELDFALERTAEKWAELERAEQAAEDRYLAERIATANSLRERYEAMLADVRAWIPPTEEHQGLKDFMVEQLTSSIEHDCHVYSRPRRNPLDPDYRTRELERLQKALVSAKEQLYKEHDIVESQNRWVHRLRESLTTQGA